MRAYGKALEDRGSRSGDIRTTSKFLVAVRSYPPNGELRNFLDVGCGDDACVTLAGILVPSLRLRITSCICQSSVRLTRQTRGGFFYSEVGVRFVASEVSSYWRRARSNCHHGQLTTPPGRNKAVRERLRTKPSKPRVFNRGGLGYGNEPRFQKAIQIIRNARRRAFVGRMW